MTIEETIKHLKFIKDGYQNLIDNDVRAGEAIGKDIKAEWESEKTMAEVYMKMIISLEIAIKMLESQPCEDCISREAVNALIDELARAISDERCFVSKGVVPRGRETSLIMRDILALPSVTPKTDVLDKIRAEIEALTDGAEHERIWNVDVLEIIDKYKAESE